MAMPEILKDFGAWIEGIVMAVVSGYEGLKKYRKTERMSKVKVIFLTSDYGIYGLNEELTAIVNNEEDICLIDGFERLFFGDEKRGIITYRDTLGQDYVIITDGNHEVIDSNKLKGFFKLKSDTLNIPDLTNISQIAEKEEKLKKKLDALNIRDFGVTLDLNVEDDHLRKKDLTVWAKKVMNHGFFKSLTKFPGKMILLLVLLGFFIGITSLFTFEFFAIVLYFTLRLLI
jgi:hypothetical protein